MPKICVEIEIDTETGELMVHQCEPKEEMQGEMEQGGGQSFQDLESALQAAGQILTSEQGAGGAGEMQAAMQGGYDKMMGNKAPPAGAGNQYQEM